MPSSGTSATVTSDDTAVTLVALQTIGFKHVLVVNEGTIPGFWTKDGVEWHRLPAQSYILLHFKAQSVRGPLQVKRIPSGTNLGSIYGSLI